MSAPITFSIREFKTLRFEYCDPQISNFDRRDVRFSHKSKLHVDVSDKSVSVHLAIDISHVPSDSRLATIETKCVFGIANMENLAVEGGVKLPDQLVAMFLGLTLSTTRGILIEKGKGTFLETVVLPVIDLDALMKKRTAPVRPDQTH